MSGCDVQAYGSDIEMILAALLEVLLGIVLQVVCEFLFAIGWVAVSSPFRRRREMPVALAATGIVVIAAASGWFYDLVFPRAILDSSPLSGVSILVSPIVVGALTHLGGRWLKKSGRPSTHLMTFWGGALFAFVLAAIRFLLVH